MAGELVLVMLSKDFGATSLPRPAGQGADYSNTKALGELVYTEYVFVFELAAVILLVAIIAAISLTLRRRPTTRYQAPERQVKVRKADRVRMVTLPSRPEDDQ
jgi:NADH-quinone oxidoreductase subunit J